MTCFLNPSNCVLNGSNNCLIDCSFNCLNWVDLSWKIRCDNTSNCWLNLASVACWSRKRCSPACKRMSDSLTRVVNLPTCACKLSLCSDKSSILFFWESFCRVWCCRFCSVSFKARGYSAKAFLARDKLLKVNNKTIKSSF